MMLLHLLFLTATVQFSLWFPVVVNRLQLQLRGAGTALFGFYSHHLLVRRCVGRRAGVVVMDGPEGDGGWAAVLLKSVQVPDGKNNEAVMSPISPPHRLHHLVKGFLTSCRQSSRYRMQQSSGWGFPDPCRPASTQSQTQSRDRQRDIKKTWVNGSQSLWSDCLSHRWTSLGSGQTAKRKLHHRTSVQFAKPFSASSSLAYSRSHDPRRLSYTVSFLIWDVKLSPWLHTNNHMTKCLNISGLSDDKNN